MPGGHIDDAKFDRFGFLAGQLPIDHLRLAHGKFETLAPHIFDQDRQVQHAATGDVKLLRRRPRLHPQRDVFLHLLLEPIAQVARGEELARPPGEGGITDAKRHVERGFVDADDGKRHGLLDARDGVADIDRFEPDHGADVTGRHFRGFGSPQSVKNIQLGDSFLALRAVPVNDGHVMTGADRAGKHAPDADAADVIAVVQRGNEHLKRRIGLDVGWRYVVDDRVEQSENVIRVLGRIRRGISLRR